MAIICKTAQLGGTRGAFCLLHVLQPPRAEGVEFLIETASNGAYGSTTENGWLTLATQAITTTPDTVYWFPIRDVGQVIRWRLCGAPSYGLSFSLQVFPFGRQDLVGRQGHLEGAGHDEGRFDGPRADADDRRGPGLDEPEGRP